MIQVGCVIVLGQSMCPVANNCYTPLQLRRYYLGDGILGDGVLGRVVFDAVLL